MTALVFRGRVEKGEGIATRLGCPTANVAIEHGGIIPGLGVYAGEAEHRGKRYPAVICVNDGRDHSVLKMEVHLLGDCPKLDGEFLLVRLLQKQRALVPWESEEQMRALIEKDVGAAKEWFRTYKTE
jgi:FAD synthase